jgi:hypothetical protein
MPAKEKDTRQSKASARILTVPVPAQGVSIIPAEKPVLSIAGGLPIGYCSKYTAGNLWVPVVLPNGTIKITGKPKGRFLTVSRLILWFACSIQRITKKRLGSIPDSGSIMKRLSVRPEFSILLPGIRSGRIGLFPPV